MVKSSPKSIIWGSSLDQQLARLIEQDFVPKRPAQPVRVPSFDSTSLPDAASWTAGLIYSPDVGDFKGSDGVSWNSLSGGGGGGSGTVTSVATGTGLTGGTITTTGTISLAAIANNRVLANVSGGSAAPTATAFSALTGVGDALKWTTARTLSFTGDVTGSGSVDGSTDVGTALTISNGVVTLAKIANASASSRVLGSGSSGAGASYSELTLGSGLEMNGTQLRSGVSGVAVVDFGSSGASDASVAVADTSVTVNSVILAQVLAKASADHSADEHLVEELQVMAGGISAGVGFSIYARARNFALRGTWNVAYHRMG